MPQQCVRRRTRQDRMIEAQGKAAQVRKTVLTAEPLTAIHGGQVYEAARRFGIRADEIVDFSANINPCGPPPGVLAALADTLTSASLGVYPDPYTFLAALAEKHQVSPDAILLGNGTAALMFAVLRAILPARVALLEPAFSEYSRACMAVQATVTRWLLTQETGFAPDFVSLARCIEARQVDLVILNSPHNPTGTLYAPEALLALVHLAEAHGVTVMLDEAFMDYAPQASLLHVAAKASRCIVFRSLTKFYAMPGLRIGYAVCGVALASTIRAQIEAWPVSTAALEAGRAALAEEEYAARSRRLNAQARDGFADALRGLGLCVFPSAANFLLARLPYGSGAELARWLEPQRVLIRQCISFQGLGDAFIRLAVRSPQDNLRLVTLIAAWLKQAVAGNGHKGVSGGYNNV